MNKKQFINELKIKLNLPKTVIENQLNLTIDLIKEILLKGNKISFFRFGTFYIKDVGERNYYNPSIRRVQLVEPKKVIAFRSTKKLI